MIITLISLGVLLTGIIFAVLECKWEKKHRCWNIDNSYRYVIAIIGIIVGSITVIIELFVIFFMNNGLHYKSEKIRLNKTIESLNATYSTISKREDNSIIEITEYNTKVKEYKTEIEFSKAVLNSWWLNWFECRVYNNFTGDEVQYFKERNNE